MYLFVTAAIWLGNPGKWQDLTDDTGMAMLLYMYSIARYNQLNQDHITKVLSTFYA
jgi:hypothetical protein